MAELLLRYQHGRHQSPCKLAVLNIQRELREIFPDQVFDVRETEKDCIFIEWTGYPAPAEVEVVTCRYETMRIDAYNRTTRKTSEFNKLYGGALYVLLSNQFNIKTRGAHGSAI